MPKLDPKRLQTREQVIAQLRDEVEKDGLKITALRYDLAPQQVSDCIHGRTRLSRRMYTKMKWTMYEFFARSDGK